MQQPDPLRIGIVPHLLKIRNPRPSLILADEGENEGGWHSALSPSMHYEKGIPLIAMNRIIAAVTKIP